MSEIPSLRIAPLLLFLFGVSPGAVASGIEGERKRAFEPAAGPNFYEPFFFRFDEGEPGPRRSIVDVYTPAPRDAVSRTQYVNAPPPAAPEPAGYGQPTGLLDSSTFDPPIDYGGPAPSEVEDIEARDGPRIPEPMVFDLVRGLGARRGEFEVNVLNLVPFKNKGPKYEWAPEIEWAVADGFAIEYEVPIFDTQIVAHKFAAQYTFGTALDDAFIHGVQGIGYFDTVNGDFIPTLLYLAGMRLDKTWTLFGMFGGSVGPQTFPFSDEPSRDGTDIIVNTSIFANITERLVLGVETNYSRQLRGPSELLFMPQVHYEIRERVRAQFGIGMRDDVEGRHPELGFRVIFER